MIRQELKAVLSNKVLLVSFIGVMMIPLLYAGVFLWAFWDPYGHLDQLPVAVVNSDKGAQYEGEQLHIGDDLVKELKKSGDFDFHFVKRQEALDGLENHEYYMMIDIPDVFSQNAATLLDEEPQKLELVYTTNESYNFISSQIADSAMKQIRASVQKEVTETYADSMMEAVEKMSDGYAEAGAGAEKIDNGAIELKKGADQLKEKLTTLASSSVTFTSGVEKARDGSKEAADGAKALAGGIGQLVDGEEQLVKGAAELDAGAKKLVAGAASLHDGLSSASASMPALIDGTASVQAGLQSISKQLPALSDGTGAVKTGAQSLQQGLVEFDQQVTSQLAAAQSAQLQAIAQVVDKQQLAQIEAIMASGQTELSSGISAGLQQLEAGSAELAAGAASLDQAVSGDMSGGLKELSSGVGRIQEGQQTLQSGLTELSKGSASLTGGASEVKDGSSQLASGAAQLKEKTVEAQKGADALAAGTGDLYSGLQELAGGSGQMASGAKQLADGSGELATGTGELEKGVNELKAELSSAAEESKQAAGSEETAAMMADPVQTEGQTVHEVPNYGTGMAPYMLSLGLFVGAIMVTIIMPLKEPAAQPKSGGAWFAGKLTLFFITGAVQAAAACSFLLFVLGIHVQSVPLFYAVGLITSMCFMTIIQLLATLFGNPGRFVAVLMLISQLTATGGTFPLELVPAPLQHLTGFLPMAYSINAFRAVISSGDYSFMWENTIVLGIIALACMTITLLAFRGYFKKQYGRLQAA